MSEMTIKALDYRELPAWPGYRVGNDGTVWSRKVRGGNDRRAGKLRSEWRELSQHPNPSGYSSVNLFRNGKTHVVPVCHLVLATFVGPRPKGMEVCHFPDRSPKNNRLDNLRWDTPQGNWADRRVHGTVTSLRGVDNPSSKLTGTKVLEIVRRLRAGEEGKAVAAAFGVTAATVSGIWCGLTWTHVTGLKRKKVRRDAK